MGLNLDKLHYDDTDANTLADSPQVGAHLLDGNDAAITSTLVGSDQALDVYLTGITFAEDSAAAGGESGIQVLGVRRDADTSPVSADGDFHGLVFDNTGRLKVAAAVTVEPSDAEYAEDAASAGGNTLISIGSVRQDTLTTDTSADGDYAFVKSTADGALWVALAGSTSVTVSGNVADDAADAGNPIKIGTRAIDGLLGAVSADDDRADGISDLYRRLYINDAPNVGVNYEAASIGTTATELVSTPLAGRMTILVQNLGPRTAYIGNDSSVTAANGIQLQKGSSIELRYGEDLDIFAISEAAAGSDLRILEVA